MQPRTFKNAVYTELAMLGRGLSNAHRLELLDLLAQGPRSVDELASASARPVANASQHLQVLARAGLVERHREANRIIYRLAPGVAALLVVLRRLGDQRLAGLAQHRQRFSASHPDVESVGTADVAEGLALGSMVLIDVRPEREYRQGHIGGARSVSLDRLDKAMRDLPRETEIIACCRGPWCTFAVEAVERLRAAGFRARRFEAGVDDWRADGGSVEA